MRITSKGQVTIPIDIREELGLLPGTEIEFIVEGDHVRIDRVSKPRRASRGQALVRAMRGKATAGLTTDEIMALTRSE